MCQGFLFIGFGISAAFIIRHNYRVGKAASKVKAAYSKQGIEWEFWYNPTIQYKILFDEDFEFIQAHDSPELREAKEALLAERDRMWTACAPGFIAMVIAFALTIICFLRPFFK